MGKVGQEGATDTTFNDLLGVFRMTWNVLRNPGHSEKFLEISGTPVKQMGQEDPVLLILVPVKEEGEEDGDDNEDSGGDVGRIGPFSEEVLRSGILCDP